MKEKIGESEASKNEKKSLPIVSPGIGSRIKAAIEKIGTRKYAASVAGVSEDMLYRYIREQSSPAFTAIVGLSKASGYSMEWLATGKGMIDEDNQVKEPGVAYQSARMPVIEHLPSDVYAMMVQPLADLASSYKEREVLMKRTLVILNAAVQGDVELLQALTEKDVHKAAELAVAVIRANG